MECRGSSSRGGRDAPTKISGDYSGVVDMGEGVNSSVAVTRNGDNLFFHVAGKIEASSAPADMRLQRTLGHLPALSADAKVEEVLIVGCGAG